MMPRFLPHRSAHHADGSPRRGMVLIIVMIVIVIVSLAGFSFAALMFTERKAVALHGDELQLVNAVDSGEELLRSILAQPRHERELAGGTDDNPELFRAVSLAASDESSRQALFSVVSPRVEDDETVGLRFGIEDESSRLNLAVLDAWEKQQPGSARRALINLPGMTESAADSILDWIDADTQPRAQGAEEEYYAGLEPSYQPRNAPPQSLAELLLVKDATRELLFGGDADRNYRVDEYESQTTVNNAMSAATHASRPWASYLTVYSAEGNMSRQGRPRVNLNDGNLGRLHQSLSVLLNPQSSRFIIAFRQYGPHKGNEATVVDDGLALDLSHPAKFRIASVFDLIGARVAIPASSKEKPAKILASPFRDDRESMRIALPKLLDLTTVSDASVTVGRVNVNRAPQAVLAGVPGIDDALAEQIVSARQAQRGQDEPVSRDAAWLLAEGLVDLAKMKALAPYVNGGGDVFRAQIVGCFAGADRSPTARVEVIIDATTGQPRRLCREDLRMLGRGFSLDELGGRDDVGGRQSASLPRQNSKRASFHSEQR
ncbi:MAG: hypothetical protein WD648_08505 [Planctomycetaceae bacterium]